MLRNATVRAILGVVIISGLLPCLAAIIYVMACAAWDTSSCFRSKEGVVVWGDVLRLVVAMLSVGVVCSTLIPVPFALILMWRLRRRLTDGERDARRIMRRGAIRGLLLPVANAFGCLGMTHGVMMVRPAPLGPLASFGILALWFSAGAAAGAWVGWEAYREKYPRKPWFPSFSLMTLTMLVATAGFIVLLLFV